MATNNFKPFGISNGANVTSQADYEALAALLTGFTAGKASSAQINKALRQGTVMASVLAQFISDSASVDVLDDGSTATILANLKKGMTALTPGRLLNVRVFTTSGTYTPTPGTAAVVVELLGAGGAGGGVTTTTGGAAAPGGGGGGYGRKRITSGFSGVTVTIGAGGTGGAFAAGGNGGGSSFGTLMTCSGGTGGGVGSVTTSNVVPMGVVGAGGSATLADVSVFGGSGQVGLAGPSFSQSGQGGCSEYAPPTFGPSSVSGSGYISNGVAALANRGAGGSGAVGLNNSIQASGGPGSSGLCIVWEYS
ncbi:hypothetical protein AB6859_23565 [Rahnella inusitata]|uniref:glycine-rich domain-containing protein n=1 Tax=Rahnella inusitata TaxID=58169 RepID=UPI0039BEA851